MTVEEKRKGYRRCEEKLAAILGGSERFDEIAVMATVATVLHQEFPQFFWTGFYRLDPSVERRLVIGPYQGTVGCLTIDFDRGVCGAAARTQETQVVPDVHAFPGHISCDARSQSEIVVPVVKKGELLAVLDVDSTEIGAFNEVDREELEALVRRFFT